MSPATTSPVLIPTRTAMSTPGSGDLGVQRLHRLDDLQPGLNRAPRIVLVGARKAEIHQDAVADVVADVAVEPADDLGAGLLVAADHLTQIFRVHPGRKRRGADHVAEHHGQLAALGLAAGWGGRGRLGRRFGASPARRVGQLGDRAHQSLAVAERDPELRQVGLGQIRQNVEVDVVLGEQLGISLEADLLEPFVHLRHSTTPRGAPDLWP